MENLKYPERFLKHLISAPFIYLVFFGFVVLDVLVELYHRVCFPLYGLDLVDRKKYIKFDRSHLPYLSRIQKINCAYCSYGNGLINYVKEIAGQTEKYWCGIRHLDEEGFQHPDHHKEFLPYGDQNAYMVKYGKYKKEKCKLFE